MNPSRHRSRLPARYGQVAPAPGPGPAASGARGRVPRAGAGSGQRTGGSGMSEPTAPQGPAPADPLEDLLRATGQQMDYPPPPPLAAAVRARLEREASARPARRWRWLPG